MLPAVYFRTACRPLSENVGNNPSKLRNTSEERMSHLRFGLSLKSDISEDFTVFAFLLEDVRWKNLVKDAL